MKYSNYKYAIGGDPMLQEVMKLTYGMIPMVKDKLKLNTNQTEFPSENEP